MGDFNILFSPIHRSSKQKLNREMLGLTDVTDEMGLTDTTEHFTQTQKNTSFQQLMELSPKLTMYLNTEQV